MRRRSYRLVAWGLSPASHPVRQASTDRRSNPTHTQVSSFRPRLLHRPQPLLSPRADSTALAPGGGFSRVLQTHFPAHRRPPPGIDEGPLALRAADHIQPTRFYSWIGCPHSSSPFHGKHDIENTQVPWGDHPRPACLPLPSSRRREDGLRILLRSAFNAATPSPGALTVVSEQPPSPSLALLLLDLAARDEVQQHHDDGNHQ
jgi:hypothetical protein